MTKTIEGQLEIDAARGVIYFHGNDGRTRLRICRLPVDSLGTAEFIDITAPERTSYTRDHTKETHEEKQKRLVAETPEERDARYRQENAECQRWYLGFPLGGK